MDNIEITTNIGTSAVGRGAKPGRTTARRLTGIFAGAMEAHGYKAWEITAAFRSCITKNKQK